MSPSSWQDVLITLFDRYARLGRRAQSVLSETLDPDLVEQALSLAEYAPSHLHEIDKGKANRWF